MNEMPAGVWLPEKNKELQVGPPRWNGTTMVVDASIGTDARILQLGLREQLTLSRIDGAQTPTQIADSLAASSIHLSEQQVWETLNKLAYFGLIYRPYSDDVQEVAEADDQRNVEPRTKAEVYVPRVGRALSLWTYFISLGSPIVASVVFVFASAGALGIVLNLPQAIDTIAEGRTPVIGLLACLAIAIVWNLVVMLFHEMAHSGAFYGKSGRTPFLAIVRFGVALLPTSHLPGLNLLRTVQKAEIVVLGPATSLAFALLPASLVFFADSGSVLRTYGAVSLIVEAVVIAIGLTFIPNADIVRFVETLSGVENLHVTSWRSITGKYKVPAALPVRSKLAIFGYPVLLLLSLVAWAVAATWAIRLALN